MLKFIQGLKIHCHASFWSKSCTSLKEFQLHTLFFSYMFDNSLACEDCTSSMVDGWIQAWSTGGMVTHAVSLKDLERNVPRCQSLSTADSAWTSLSKNLSHFSEGPVTSSISHSVALPCFVPYMHKPATRSSLLKLPGWRRSNALHLNIYS